MFRIHATHFVFLLFVSVVSVGCLGVDLQPAPNRFGPLSPISPSVLPDTSSALTQPASPLAGQTQLDLAALRHAVLQRNPTITAMQHAWQAAVERRPQISSLDDPMFSYALAPATIGSNRLDFGQRFELSQRFPWPGTLRLRGEVAQSEAQAASEDLHTVRLQLIEATQHAFYDYYFVERAIDINRVNQDLLLEFQRTAEFRYAAGLVPKQEVLQAEVEHQHLAHRGIVLDRTRVVTVARLNTLLNLPPENTLPPPPHELPGVQSLPGMETLRAAAVQHRPELRSLALQVEARNADVKLAQLDYFPSVTVSGGYNSLWQEDDLRPIVGVSLNFPLQLNRQKAAVREAQAKERQARARLEEQRARVFFEVSQATENVRENAHVVQLYASSIVPAAEENLTAARSDYETGITDFLILITADKALMLAELSYHQALANYHKGRTQLERAAGLSLEDVEVMP